ncbi:MAG: hypothetical protein R2762_19800 [Bryobacteraceae bacterium]
MHTLIQHAGIREAVAAEAGPLLASLLAAEMFYKFHSFTLECGAFLATWYALSRAAAACKLRLPVR